MAKTLCSQRREPRFDPWLGNRSHMLPPKRSYMLHLRPNAAKKNKYNFLRCGSDIVSICLKPFQRRQWHPTPVLLPGKSHGWRSLVDCRSWGCEESDTTERLHFHSSLPCTGEGNGNPLQCSCLENPRDRGAWWAAVYGVAQSRTQLKRRSSNSLNPFSGS